MLLASCIGRSIDCELVDDVIRNRRANRPRTVQNDFDDAILIPKYDLKLLNLCSPSPPFYDPPKDFINNYISIII